MIHNTSSESSLDAEVRLLPQTTEVYVPHVGWLCYPEKDDVLRFLREGWFEYDIQSFLFLYLRAGDRFIDCGAHAGLYSVLAGKRVGPTGRVISVEPNPAILELLNRNIEANGVTCATSVQTALYSRRQEMKFYPGAADRSAYGSLFNRDTSADGIRLETATLGQICNQFGVTAPAVVKIDVEGSETEVLKGICDAGGARDFPLLIIEFTELNLQAAGSSTLELFRALESSGYHLFRFDADGLELEPVKFDNPVWHANYFAVAQPGAVTHILESASHESRRIATEVIERGRACERLHKFADQWQAAGSPGVLLEKTLTQLDDAYQRVGEANWRADRANDRSELALRQTEEAQKLLKEAQQHVEAATRQAESATHQAESATHQAEFATHQAESATHQAESATRQAESAMRQSSDFTHEMSGLCMTLGEVRQERDSLNQRIDFVKEVLRVTRSRLQELVGSRYVRLGRMVRILKPGWLDQGDPSPALDAGPDDMDRAFQHLSWKQFRPNVVLDVGAAKGSWSLRAAQVWPGAQYYMIDPLTENEKYLKGLSETDTRFHYLQTAVGDEVSDLVMNVTPDHDGSSLLSWAGEDPNRQRRIPVTTLDHLIADGKLAQPELVKIDVQGFELKVLKGGERVFQSAEVFIVEVNLYEFMRGCPRVHEIVAFFAERGFYLFDIAGTLRRPFDNNLAQMDLVLASSASMLADSNRWT